MERSHGKDASSIIKIGGSLLSLGDLPDRFTRFLAARPRPRPIALCGGGPVVDVIRGWDRVYGLGEEASHWISLRAMTPTAMVAERILPQLERVTTDGEIEEAWQSGRIPLFDAYAFISGLDERTSDPLPRRWCVTSDSIAARMAARFGAPEVVLLKSATLADGTTPAQAARGGYVDPYFPVAARGLQRVVTLNLRDEKPVERLMDLE